MPVAGIQQQFWGKNEATYDTVSAFAATDAFDAVELTFEPELNYEEIVSHVGTGSLQGEVQQNRGGKWSGSFNVAPNAAATAPDIGFLIKAAMGTETVGGSDVTYSFSDGNVFGTSLHSLQLGKYAGTDLYEVVNGAWVEQLTVEIVGNQIPKITASGGFASYGYLYGSPTVNGVHSASDTTIDLASGGGVKVGANALIKFGTEDNGGAGYTVVSISGDTVTITPGLAGGLSGGEAVEPVVPSQTLGGTVLGGTDSGLTIDATSLGLVTYKLTINTGIKPLDKEASSNRSTAIFRQEMRKLEGEITAYFKDESTAYLGGAWSGTLRDIAARAGSATGRRLTCHTDSARVGVAAVPFTDSEVTIITLPFTPRQNAAAADEATLVFE